MKKYCFSVVCCIMISVIVCGCSSDLSLKDTIDFKSLPGYLDETVPGMITFLNPAVQIALVENGEIIYEKAFGFADWKNKVPADTNTIFQVASVSKSVTAWGLLALAESGLISLDDSVQSHVKRWTLPDTRFDESGVTIRRAMSHCAGLNLHGYAGYHPDKNPLPSLEESLSGKSGSVEVKTIYKPGSKFSYSGGGYTFMQLMMEEITPSGYCSYMNNAVLIPLGMNSSTFEYGEVDLSHLAKPYNVLGIEIPNYLFTEKAAAGLYTTAGDLARVLNEMYHLQFEPDYQGKIISQESYENFLTPLIQVDNTVFYGTGYCIRNLENGSAFISHGGSNFGWQCTYGIDISSGRGLVVLTNSDNGTKIYDKIESVFLKSVQ